MQYGEDEGEPPSPPRVRRALKAALNCSAEITVRFAGRREAASLHRRFLGGRHLPAVLAFPDNGGNGALSADIAICPTVVESEARKFGMPAEQRYAHLLVHAALHLLGHRHDSPAAAERMERAEKRALAKIGLPDPYTLP